MEESFLVDVNAVKLARWLRMLGYDAKVVPDADDSCLIMLALKEKRVLLTRDTQIMLRRIVTTSKLKALLLLDDDPKQQLYQVVTAMGLDYGHNPFTRCLECNQTLINRNKNDIQMLVPKYVFETQAEFKQCPSCNRTYWRGTHWLNMSKEMKRLQGGAQI